MAGIFDYIPFIGGGAPSISRASLAMIGFWTIIILCVCGVCMFLFFLWLHHKLSTRAYEISMGTKRLRRYWGRIKKDKNLVWKYFCRKMGKDLPLPQQKDLYLEGKKDALMLLKDNNGFHHTLRLPTWKELVKFYSVVYGIDIVPKKNPTATNPLYDVFWLPNPHENLEWLATQCIESDKEFKDTKWWQHPTVLVLGTAFICAIMFIMTLVLTRG